MGLYEEVMKFFEKNDDFYDAVNDLCDNINDIINEKESTKNKKYVMEASVDSLLSVISNSLEKNKQYNHV